MNAVYYGNTLVHHGVKGQRWGVRQYQFADGSLTPEGRVHYGYDNPSYSRVIKTKIREISEKGGYISKKAASYITGKNLVDSYLSAGTNFSRVQTSKDFESQYAFYATYKKHDMEQYQGLFGKNLKQRAKYRDDLTDEEKKNMKVYKLDIKAQQKLKVPSDENAAHITGNLLKEKEFKENLRASIIDSKGSMKRPQQQALFNDALKAIDKQPPSEKEKKTLYKALNLTLTNHNAEEVAMQNRFYDEMKKKGYSALVDINDKEYSSYHAHRPMIVFDTDKVKMQSATELDDAKVEKLYKKYNNERLVKDGIHQVMTALPSLGKMTIDAARDYNQKRSDDYLGQKNKKSSDAKASQIKSMLNSGATQAEVAEKLGVSTSTIQEVMR